MSMGELRAWLATRNRQVAAGVCVAVGLVALVLLVMHEVGPGEAATQSRRRLFICSESGKSFTYEIDEGMMIPVLSPFTHRNTGYLAELCYWTADGQAKADPTPVLLNRYRKAAEPTFCPDCGRLVVHLNPAPEPGRQAPPTQEQMRGAEQTAP
jgi:hypothetical protein